MFVFTSAGETAVSFTPGGGRFPVPGARSPAASCCSTSWRRRVGLVVRLCHCCLSIDLMIYLRSLGSPASWGSCWRWRWCSSWAWIAALVGQIVAEAVYTRMRKVVLAVVAVALRRGSGPGLLGACRRGTAASWSRSFGESPALRVVLAPFEVFTRAIFAEAVVPGSCWAGGAAALAIDLGLLHPDPEAGRGLPRVGRDDQPEGLRAHAAGEAGRGLAMPVERRAAGSEPAAAPLAGRGRPGRLAATADRRSGRPGTCSSSTMVVAVLVPRGAMSASVAGGRSGRQPPPSARAS